jgi:hypothetical protein
MTDVIQEREIIVFHIGDLVRYAKTGTVGEIVEITEQNGTMFAELNSTNLLYRLDTLTPISAATLIHNTRDPDDQDMRREIEKAIAKAADDAFHDTTTELDSACAGAG